MDYKFALAIALPLGLAIVGFGSAMALGKAVTAAMDATGRQPEAATKILINMAAGCALIEALTIYVLVFALVLAGKLV
ncbi:MAG: ATP synthase F0 subunit C [Candidatus Omnitrophica bacterium]|nr:ATP synthase F0 subunit C [Candidatus Omnitrophota bacterium]MBU1870074.1 ATP synthase F0 subunit C [Candidatus Omnitrophota bacterium]